MQDSSSAKMLPASALRHLVHSALAGRLPHRIQSPDRSQGSPGGLRISLLSGSAHLSAPRNGRWLPKFIELAPSLFLSDYNRPASESSTSRTELCRPFPCLTLSPRPGSAGSHTLSPSLPLVPPTHSTRLTHLNDLASIPSPVRPRSLTRLPPRQLARAPASASFPPAHQRQP